MSLQGLYSKSPVTHHMNRHISRFASREKQDEDRRCVTQHNWDGAAEQSGAFAQCQAASRHLCWSVNFISSRLAPNFNSLIFFYIKEALKGEKNLWSLYLNRPSNTGSPGMKTFVSINFVYANSLENKEQSICIFFFSWKATEAVEKTVLWVRATWGAVRDLHAVVHRACIFSLLV